MAFKFDLPNIWGLRKFAAPNFQMPRIVQPGPTTVEQIMPNQSMQARPSPFAPRQLGTPNLDEYNRYIGMMPQRENPNIWTKLAAAAGGISDAYFNGPGSGYQTAVGIRDYPYQRKLSDWQEGVTPRLDAAKLESLNLGRENAAERNQITDRYNQGRVEIGKMNAETARLKLGQGNWQWAGVTDSGNPILIDRVSGNPQVLSDVDTYSPREKFEADLAAAMARVEAQQAGALQRTGITASTSRANTRDRIAASERMQEDRQQFDLENPNLGRSTGLNTSWEQYQDQQTLVDLASKNPAWRGKIIFTNPTTGRLFFSPPEESSNIFGNNQELLNEYDKFYQAYQAAKSGRTQPTSSGNKPVRSTSTVRMIDAQGNEYNVPASEVSAAMKDGLRKK